MGVSSDGILAFGIDLGEELPEVFQRFEEDHGEFDFEDYLLEEAGFREKFLVGMSDKEYHDYSESRRKIINESPVGLVLHCSYDYPMYILCVNGTGASSRRGEPLSLSGEDLEVTREQIDAMEAWCKIRDIPWEEPTWLLASMYG